MKILLIQYKMLGDVLTTSVLLEPLKKKYPKGTLDYLISKPSLQLMQGNPYVDNFIIPDEDFENSTLAVFRLALKVRKSNYDIVIDVYGKLRSQITTLFSGASYKIAWKKTVTQWIYTHSLERLSESKNGMSLAIANRYLLLEPLQFKVKQTLPELYLSKTEIDKARLLLSKHGIKASKPLYMISLLGSNESKTYPVEYMTQLVDYITSIQPDSQILFNYLPNQTKEALNIYESLETESKKNVIFDLYADSLRSLLSLMYHCDAVIGNEGGAINMAKALNINSFIIFAPYLRKKNWFGELEKTHVAVHLADFVSYDEIDYLKSKKKPIAYYHKFQPSLIFPKLKTFIESL